MVATGPAWLLLEAIGTTALALAPKFGERISQVFVDLVEFGNELHQKCQNGGLIQRMPEVLTDLAKLSFAPNSDERVSLDDLVSRIAAERPKTDQDELVKTLVAVPARVRQSLKRPSDPSGLSAAAWQIHLFKRRDGVHLLLPPRCPLFTPGDQAPGIPEWELVELLGVGGYGEVWRAKPKNGENQARAIKFCTDETAARILKNEAKVVSRAAQANQPGLVRLLETYLLGPTPALAYEYVDGIELGAWFLGSIKEGKRFTPIELGRLVLQLVEIIASVHALDPPIVHRDLKPANILMPSAEFNGDFLPRITDFGIGALGGVFEAGDATRAQRSSHGQYFTQSARGAHSVRYASPEQAAGAEPSTADDVHALGMIWYQLARSNLTLHRPSGSRWTAELVELGLTKEMVELLSECFEPSNHRIPNAVILRDRLRDVIARHDPLDDLEALLPRFQDVARRLQPQPPREFEGSNAGEEFTNDLGMKLCWCPPGKFTMGSPKNEPDRYDDEDQVQVNLTRGFWLGKFQVTEAEYEAIVGEDPSDFTSVSGQDTKRFPVEQVDWNEAMEFCRLLTERERQAGRLPADWEYSLPTEAQWEYACRATTKSATAFGDSLNSKQANFNGNYPYNGASKGPYREYPSVVGSYPANAWGLHDMHGNVLEWCRDGYESRRPGGNDPFVQYDGAALRVHRGGSWYNRGEHCRSAYRGRREPSYRYYDLGLRVAAVRSDSVQINR